MSDEWSVDDEVVRLLSSVGVGGDRGFVAASLQISDDEAIEALERLEGKHVLRSGIVRSSGGHFRCWVLA